MQDGTEQSQNLTTIQKITFSNGNLVLDTKNSDVFEPLSLSAIAKMVFNTTTLGIETNETNPGALGVYPNPATNLIYIKNAPSKLSNILIFTADGRMVLQTQISSSDQPIDISRLVQGFYLLKIDSSVFKFKKS